jgi:hypothetical protein
METIEMSALASLLSSPIGFGLLAKLYNLEKKGKLYDTS